MYIQIVCGPMRPDGPFLGRRPAFRTRAQRFTFCIARSGGRRRGSQRGSVACKSAPEKENVLPNFRLRRAIFGGQKWGGAGVIVQNCGGATKKKKSEQ